MDLKDIKGIARKWGVKASRLKKDEIIRAIQRAEGNFDCFGTAVCGHCTQSDLSMERRLPEDVVSREILSSPLR